VVGVEHAARQFDATGSRISHGQVQRGFQGRVDRNRDEVFALAGRGGCRSSGRHAGCVRRFAFHSKEQYPMTTLAQIPGAMRTPGGYAGHTDAQAV
jgi:hypothetical protein